MPNVTVVHSYSDDDGQTYQYDPSYDVDYKTLSYAGQQVIPDWSRTKQGMYKVDRVEIIDLAVNLTINYLVEDSPYSGPDVSSTTTESGTFTFDPWNAGYEYSLYVQSYYGGSISDDPFYYDISGNSGLYPAGSESDFKSDNLYDGIIANFYYYESGGNNESGWDWDPEGNAISSEVVNFGDIYNFQYNRNYVMNIYYSESTPEPDGYAHLHVIHNYDGFLSTNLYNETDCSDISSALVPAGQRITSEFLSEKIQPLYREHEYVYDSMSLHYETTGTSSSGYNNIGYYNYNNYYDYFEYSEVMVVGDTFDPEAHLESLSAPTGSSGTLYDYFNDSQLSFDNPDPIEILRVFYGYFTFSLVHPLIESPITYFQNERVEMKNEIDFEDYHVFEEGIHYILVINYKAEFPITHHYADGSEEHILTEGKTVTYGENTNLTMWSKPDFSGETYTLKRIDLIESNSKLTVRHYSDGGQIDQFGNLGLTSLRTYAVMPDSYIRVGNYIEYPNFNGYNTKDSDQPWRFDYYSGSEDDAIAMSVGNNLLNMFYSYTIPRAFSTIADLNGYLWIRWTADVMDAWYTFDEAKTYEVHYYYEKDGITTYRLTYEANSASGTVPVDNTDYPANTYATVMTKGDLEMFGSEFICWNTESDGSGMSYYPDDIMQNKVLMDDDYTLYAIWNSGIEVNHIYDPGIDEYQEMKYVEPNSQFDLNLWNRSIHNGNVYYISDIEVFKNGTQDSAYIYFNDPVYTFGRGSTYCVNITYYDYGPISYFLTYDENGADSGNPPVSEWYNHRDSVTIKDNIGPIGDGSDILVKDGYNFNGWNTWSDGTGTSYPVDHIFNIESDLYLFAVWDPLYKVTYHKNGASGDVPLDGNGYASGDTVTVLSKGNLQMQGYTFQNWNTKIDGSGTTYSSGSTFDIYEDTDLYAQWKKNGGGGGTDPDPDPDPEPKPESSDSSTNPPAFEDEVEDEPEDASVPASYSGIALPLFLLFLIILAAVLYLRYRRRKTLADAAKEK
ncbi:InlB B-repeat-containing protein [Methanimicrococcus hongohii]|nr:InlB B-repeat-containing protein [Methanimicrococcus sp. Hf6]